MSSLLKLLYEPPPPHHQQCSTNTTIEEGRGQEKDCRLRKCPKLSINQLMEAGGGGGGGACVFITCQTLKWEVQIRHTMYCFLDSLWILASMRRERRRLREREKKGGI
jgi:hypothetical protein